ncbi:MAG: hypothetical protein NVSMB31_11170 [Vulcanimicrobiaceae bacterium]
MLNVFIRLTLLLTLGIAALIVALFVFKVVIFAAIVAAVVIGGLFVVNFLRRGRSTVGSPLSTR